MRRFWGQIDGMSRVEVVVLGKVLVRGAMGVRGKVTKLAPAEMASDLGALESAVSSSGFC